MILLTTKIFSPTVLSFKGVLPSVLYIYLLTMSSLHLLLIASVQAGFNYCIFGLKECTYVNPFYMAYAHSMYLYISFHIY